MTNRVRRRDLAIAGPKRRSRRPLLIAVVVVFFLLPVVWLALQTIGGHSTDHGAVAPIRLR